MLQSARNSKLFKQPPNTLQYEVKSMDTLAKLALMFDTTIGEIVQTNRLINRMIFPGQILYLPSNKSTDSTNISINFANAEINNEKMYSHNVSDYKDRTIIQNINKGCSLGVKFMEKGLLFQENYIQIKALSIGDGQPPILGSILFTPNLIHFQKLHDHPTNQNSSSDDKLSSTLSSSMILHNLEHQIPLKAVAYVDFYETFNHLLNEKLDSLLEPDMVKWFESNKENSANNMTDHSIIGDFDENICFDDSTFNNNFDLSLSTQKSPLHSSDPSINYHPTSPFSLVTNEKTQSIPFDRSIRISVNEHYDGVLGMVIVDHSDKLNNDQKQLLEGLGFSESRCTPITNNSWINKSPLDAQKNKQSAAQSPTFKCLTDRGDYANLSNNENISSSFEYAGIIRSNSDSQLESMNGNQLNKVTPYDDCKLIYKPNDFTNNLNVTVDSSSSFSPHSFSNNKKSSPLSKIMKKRLFNKYFKTDVSNNSKNVGTKLKETRNKNKQLRREPSLKPIYDDNIPNNLNEECRQWLEQRGIIFESSKHVDSNNFNDNLPLELLKEIQPNLQDNLCLKNVVYMSVTVNPGFWNPMLRATIISGQPKNRDIKRRQLWFVVCRESYCKIHSFLIHFNENIKNSKNKVTRISTIENNKSNQIKSVKKIEKPSKNQNYLNLSSNYTNTISQEEKSLIDLHLLPELLSTSAIIDHSILMSLSWYLPTQAVGKNMKLCFSTLIHGVSLRSLLRLSQINDGPSILVIKDNYGTIFGAILSDPLKPSNCFYGSGECVLFSNKFEKSTKIYTWTGQDDYFIKGCNSFIAIGGGGGKFGLWIDEDLCHGSTSQCVTFNNEPLTNSRDFVCKVVEVWFFEN